MREHRSPVPDPSSDRHRPEPVDARLHAQDLTLGYDHRTIVEGLSTRIPDGSFTVIIGPNACGKSTLLRGLSRLIAPEAGRVVFDGKEITRIPAKEVARRLGLLPQTALAPDGITVADLVARGRYPHQGLLRQWSTADEHAVRDALAATGTAELAPRRVDELSGGQRQRVWVAMVLAQNTDLLLLDEPTTFLDIAHQVELMELFAQLNREGRTIVAVLHDLNHAARYADHIIAMRDGRILAEGPPADVVTSELVERIYDLPNVVIADPITGGPLVVPRAAPLSQTARTATERMR
ncbi:iron complex transport system ATP-binding protein [Microbacterium dextranolyticum]|uniref:Ferric enterobactin transporter FepC n=1 Tax=Microbacterium dextranolyticum TaxID=36806 RepID=A0A9W6HM45_9MICO|nr:iron complex transport system ATP-binding protein [Microbacterium dextranolyticum]GLJ95573.1 ferric enterobactin transporter FepC [Microbacterium dextranolyticum]